MRTREPKIVRAAGGKTFWSCPNCGRTMGELIGTRVVIIVRKGIVASYEVTDTFVLSCARCQTNSSLIESDVK